MTTSRDIIRACVRFEDPERIGLTFWSDPEGTNPKLSDIAGFAAKPPKVEERWQDGSMEKWKDEWGNTWGRLDKYSKGEIVEGRLKDWKELDSYELPDLDNLAYYKHVAAVKAEFPDRYHYGSIPGFPFSIMRKLRRMDNFLMDVAEHPDEVMELSDRIETLLGNMIDRLAEQGAHGIFFAEDWGTQDRLLVSPPMWRSMFRPAFERLSERVHEHDMDLLMHSCGWIYDIIGDLVDVGVDVLQLDQPRLMGIERLGAEFGGSIAFWCPVDIQKTQPTGDKEKIRAEAKLLIDQFGSYGGGFIATGYGSGTPAALAAIEVEPEWNDWMYDAFVEFGQYR